MGVLGVKLARVELLYKQISIMSVIIPSFAQCTELTGGFSGTPDEQLKMLQAHRQSYQSIFHWRLIQIFSIKIVASLKYV